MANGGMGGINLKAAQPYGLALFKFRITVGQRGTGLVLPENALFKEHLLLNPNSVNLEITHVPYHSCC